MRAYQKSTIQMNKAYIGEPIEAKVSRIINNKEPISDSAPRIYTERKHGAQPQYDIRTDRFEIAVEAMDKVASSHRAKREDRIKSMGEQAKDGMKKEGGTQGE